MFTKYFNEMIINWTEYKLILENKTKRSPYYLINTVSIEEKNSSTLNFITLTIVLINNNNVKNFNNIIINRKK